MASERADALADEFASANEDAIAFVRRCSEEDWSRTVPGEAWPVGVVLHHVAEGHGQGQRWIRSMADGQGVAESGDDVDRVNAEHAQRAAGTTRDETALLLGTEGARLEATRRALTDTELDRTAPFGPAGGRRVPTVELVPVMARHTREHVAHARAATLGSAASSEPLG